MMKRFIVSAFLSVFATSVWASEGGVNEHFDPSDYDDSPEGGGVMSYLEAVVSDVGTSLVDAMKKSGGRIGGPAVGFNPTPVPNFDNIAGQVGAASGAGARTGSTNAGQTFNPKDPMSRRGESRPNL